MLADVIVVSYNSEDTLRDCVVPLAADDEINVIVVDNASSDRSLEVARDLSATVVPLDTNRGFAFGCNRGWEAGSAAAVLFLNPDARIDRASVRRLVSALEQCPSAGLIAPRIVDGNGSLEFSQRRFPRLRSTYAQALFLHRVFTHATWTDEVVRDPQAYEQAGGSEWVSGACVLIRRSALERLGGWDEGFFHYGEDIDICRRMWKLGLEVRYEPSVSVIHVGGVSAPRPKLRPRLAVSRIRYARLHRGRAAAMLERAGIALGELTHAALTSKGSAVRAGHWRAFRLACSPRLSIASRPARSQSAPTAVESEPSAN